MIIGADWN